MNRRSPSVFPNLTSLPYFHTNFRTSDQVKDFLWHHRNRPGSYILRPSFSKSNCVSVSVVLATGEIRHLNIQYDGSNYFLVPESKFNTIQALLQHHAVNPVHNEEQVTDVRFLYPIAIATQRGRRVTEPALNFQEYQALVADSPRSNGSSLIHSHSIGHEEGRMRSISDISGAGENFNRGSQLSTRSEGYVDGSRFRRSPSDRLPNVPRQGNISLSSRPPAALPSANGRDLGPDYSSPCAPNVNKLNQLKATLREMEISGVCDCGLPVKESQLPDGWSIHQTGGDGQTAKKRLFYQAPSGDTFWEPPEEIASQLSEIHKENIEKLKEFYLSKKSSSEAT